MNIKQLIKYEPIAKKKDTVVWKVWFKEKK